MIPQLDPQVLHSELTAIRQRRLKVFADDGGGTGELAQKVAQAVAPELGPTTSKPRADVDVEARRQQAGEQFANAHAIRPVGLAFSGGGIRSATFNLGVLQGLAEAGLLRYVDYLSTVSGGGYIGSWLHGLVRHHDGDIKRIETQLSPKTNAVPSTPQHDPVSFLRKYSNYLAPRPGLFGTDSWVIVSIWVRNVLLNQLILIPSLCAGILLLVFAGLLQQAVAGVSSPVLSASFAVAALVALLSAVIITGANLNAVKERTHPAATAQHGAGAIRLRRWASRHSGLVVPLMFVTSVILACGGLEHWSNVSLSTVAIAMLGLFLLFQITGGFVWCFAAMRADEDGTIPASARVWAVLHVLWMAPVCAAVTTALMYAVWWTVLPQLDSLLMVKWAAWLRVAFGPPLMCLSMITGAALLVGLMGADYPDAAREWVARVGASLSRACLAWIALFGIGIFGPFMFAWLLDNYALTGLTLATTWGVATAAGVIAGRSPRTDGTASGRGATILNVITDVAPTAFMVGYLLALACVVHLSVATIAGTIASGTWVADATPTVYDVRVASPGSTENVRVDVTATAVPEWLAPLLNPVVGFEQKYWDTLLLQNVPGLSLFAIWFGLVGIALVASWRFNINEFSLHHFYKNRLVRCYLGASHCKDRQANPFTGFDPLDDFPLASIMPGKRYSGPYAIVNAALNLNTGSELAQQERKATSFVFTPAYCGFQPVVTREDDGGAAESVGLRDEGYCRTRGFSSPDGLHLGTAMAISGAAANPNAGYHTSGTMAFLLTVFDARLGWWLGNPRSPVASRKPGPDIAWLYLFSELFGMTKATSQFVNVSDGGHFENLGLYELVRRRCRYIIVGDGEQDGDLKFEGLGGAVRKCRADFGVEISINPQPLRLVDGNSQAHCVVGTIRYPEKEAGQSADMTGGGFTEEKAEYARGWILYLKSTVTGDEPADVLEYRSKHKEFPHESTADQFFSESQFESYRRLGLHVVRDALEGVHRPDRRSGDLTQMLRVFQELARKWYAPIPVTDEAATRLADSYSSLLRLAVEKPMQEGGPDLLPRFGAPSGTGTKAPDVAAGVLWLEAIQLMQSVFTEFDLEFAANRANPRNAGWMNVFRRWTQRQSFYEFWESVKSDYNPVFQQFVEDLHEGTKEDWPDTP